MKCKGPGIFEGCGIELNALNMSDVELGMCNDCCDKALDYILTHNNTE